MLPAHPADMLALLLGSAASRLLLQLAAVLASLPLIAAC